MGQAEGRLGQAGDWILDPKSYQQRYDLDTLTQVGSAFQVYDLFFFFFFWKHQFIYFFILLL